MSEQNPRPSPKDDFEPFFEWEGYDSNLSPAENFYELQVQMGLLDEAKKLLAKFTHLPKNDL